MLNKRDITIAVAPEKGEDLKLPEVAKRVMNLAEKNSAAFARANKGAAERVAVISGLKTEIAALEKEKTQAQADYELAKAAFDEREIQQSLQPQSVNLTGENNGTAGSNANELMPVQSVGLISPATPEWILKGLPNALKQFTANSDGSKPNADDFALRIGKMIIEKKITGEMLAELAGTAPDKAVDAIYPMVWEDNMQKSDKPVASMLSSEITADKENAHEYRKAAFDIVRSRYGSKPPVPVDTKDGQVVLVGMGGLKHVLKDGTPTWQEAIATLHAEEIIANAEYLGSEPDYKKRAEIKAVHRHGATIEIDGEKYGVVVVVMEASDGKRYYDHTVTGKNESPTGLLADPSTNEVDEESGRPFMELPVDNVAQPENNATDEWKNGKKTIATKRLNLKHKFSKSFQDISN